MTSPFKEENLTHRDHNDPDKHWIGESLPSPTVAETVRIGTSNSTGVSPFPARADHNHQFDPTVMPKTGQTIGSQLSGTFSPGATIATLNIPAKPVSGILMVWAFLRIDKSIAGDMHSIDLYSSAGTTTYLAQDFALNYSTSLVSTLHGQTALTANTATTITTVLTRIAGTGTVQTYAQYQLNHIISLWVPVYS